MDADNLTPEECHQLYGVHHPKVPVVRRPGEYEICYEQFDVHTFVHVRLLGPWSPQVKQRFAHDVDAAAALHGGPFLVLCALSNKKLRKFCLKFGFEHAMYVTTQDGEESEILIRK